MITLLQVFKYVSSVSLKEFGILSIFDEIMSELGGFLFRTTLYNNEAQ